MRNRYIFLWKVDKPVTVEICNIFYIKYVKFWTNNRSKTNNMLAVKIVLHYSWGIYTNICLNKHK